MATKVIANYLPQYHRIPENDKWWGEGYTDWEAVKNAKSLFKGHQQPRVPLNHHYYSLDNVKEIRRQAKIAKKYGIYGFGIYHYWFSSELHLLDKPVFLLKENKDIDIHYMFIWDNGSWKRTWSNVSFANDWAPLYENNVSKENNKQGVMAELKYGNENDWKLHFEYLVQFFSDERYIKINNKPVFAFYNQNNDADTLRKMCNYWDALAQEYGFGGIMVLGKVNNKNVSITEHEFLYEPEWNGWLYHNLFERIYFKGHRAIYNIIKHPIMHDYDRIWKRIIRESKKDNRYLYSGFVSYDDTPRRGISGRIIKGGTPKKFKKYISELLKISNEKGNEFMFLTAWNEWGEGAYLEPDTDLKYSYLKALKAAIDENIYE